MKFDPFLYPWSALTRFPRLTGYSDPGKYPLSLKFPELAEKKESAYDFVLLVSCSSSDLSYILFFVIIPSTKDSVIIPSTKDSVATQIILISRLVAKMNTIPNPNPPIFPQLISRFLIFLPGKLETSKALALTFLPKT